MNLLIVFYFTFFFSVQLVGMQGDIKLHAFQQTETKILKSETAHTIAHNVPDTTPVEAFLFGRNVKCDAALEALRLSRGPRTVVLEYLAEPEHLNTPPEHFTKKTFAELSKIAEAEKQVPLILACVTDEKQEIRLYDAHAFNKHFFSRHGKKQYPIVINRNNGYCTFFEKTGDPAYTITEGETEIALAPQNIHYYMLVHGVVYYLCSHVALFHRNPKHNFWLKFFYLNDMLITGLKPKKDFALRLKLKAMLLLSKEPARSPQLTPDLLPIDPDLFCYSSDDPGSSPEFSPRGRNQHNFKHWRTAGVFRGQFT